MQGYYIKIEKAQEQDGFGNKQGYNYIKTENRQPK